MDENQQPELEPVTPIPVDNAATRVQRFIAAMIDGCLGILVTIPLFEHYQLWEVMKTGGTVPTEVSIKLAMYGLLMFFILHGTLLYRYGQTVGKRVMGLAIVTLDGGRPHFAHLILNRYLPQWVAGFIPGIGPLLGIVDALFVFRNDKRCVHDLIAGTKVIDLKIQSTPQTGTGSGAGSIIL